MNSRTRRQALRVESSEQGFRLCAPEVGIFTACLPRGSALAPGQFAGSILVLRHECELVVPPGVFGIVTSTRPERVHEPVGFGQLLYELAPLSAEGLDLETEEGAVESEQGLFIRSPQSGRFYQRPSPDADCLAPVGALLEAGQAIGLIEVMKTFTHLPYQPGAGLPERARVLRVLVEDASDVAKGDPLFLVEAAD